MMFASDLDRTLIFSRKALEDFPNFEQAELVPIEKRLEENIAFMTNTSYKLLKTISSKLLFVPVTTRSLEEYNRILFSEMSIQYAVTTNGANILYHGEPLIDWKQKMMKEMSELSIRKEELISSMQSVFSRIPGEMRVVEELFIYFYLRESIDRQFLIELKDSLSNKGWKVSLQGRKLYFMPDAISKGNAVKYIQERESVTTLIGAGDSLFDDDFLAFCHYPYVPSHGELAGSSNLKSHYSLTKNSGVKGGEELLYTILSRLEDRSS